MLSKDFTNRRKKLLSQLDKNSIAIIVAAPEVLRNGDAHYRYRQSSDFYYLTGLEEPEAVAIFAPGSDQGDFILFNRVKDKSKEQWDGYIAGQEDACAVYGADKAFPIADIRAQLPRLMLGRTKIYYDLGKPHFDDVVVSAMTSLRRQVRTGVKAPTDIISIDALVHEQRLIKSDFEVEQMRHAVNASVVGHKKAMQLCRPGLFEYHLAAEIHYEFQKHGCLNPAYSSIVGAGKNACVLHYISNNSELKDGDLVLIDAGAEYNNYAADITRSFPVNGQYSEEQKLIYELVLRSQKAALEKAKAGACWTAMQTSIIQVLTEGLVELGILKGNPKELIEQKAYLPFYMHNSGHWIGLDVHDVGTYKVNGDWRKLAAGMVITIEPGLYISANMPGVDEKWWNIGVRIEDDVLITESGNDVLSKDLPKELADIEALMNS